MNQEDVPEWDKDKFCYETNILGHDIEDKEDFIKRSLNLSHEEEMKMILASEYTFEQIDILMSSTKVISEGDFTYEKLNKFCKSVGPMSSSWHIYDNNQTVGIIWHFLGLLQTAIDHIEEGYKVHVIESTNSENVAFVNDIDLIVSKEGIVTYIDYTNSTPLRSLFGSTCTVEPSKINNFKMKVLESKTTVKHECAVLTQKSLPDKPLECVITGLESVQSELSEMIEKADYFTKLCLNFTKDDFNEMFEAGIENMKLIKDPVDLIKDLPKMKEFFKPMKAEVLEMLMNNNSETADSFCKLFKVLYDHTESLKISGKMTQDPYVLDVFPRLWEADSKSQFYIPMMLTLFNQEEDESIVSYCARLTECLSEKCKVSSDLMSVSLCNDNEYHPTDEEIIQYKDLVSDVGTFMVVRYKRVGDVDSTVFVRSVRPSKTAYECPMTKRFWESSKNTDANFVESETLINELGEYMSKEEGDTEFSSHLLELANGLLRDVDTAMGPGTLAKRLIIDDVKKTANSNLFRYLEGIQSVNDCILSCRNKLPAVKLAKLKKGESLVSVTKVNGRSAVVFNNMTCTISKTKSTVFMIAGALESIDKTGLFIRQHQINFTKWSNWSAEQQDMASLLMPKAMAWISYQLDNRTSQLGMASRTNLISKNFLSTMMMAVAKEPFSVCSQDVRYLFNNATGYTKGVADLYNKQSWYMPNTLIERVYMSRMFKMSTCLQLCKANDKLAECRTKVLARTKSSSGYITTSRTHWKVAMPQESTFFQDDKSIYNSFYVCKMLVVTNYSPIRAQAMAALKQIESRIDYLASMEDQHETTLENLKLPYDSDELKEMIKENLWSSDRGKIFQPCYLNVLMCSMATIFEHNCSGEETLRNLIKRTYDPSDVVGNLSLSSMMSNRASVMDVMPNGLSDGKQSGKCYQTLMTNCAQYIDETIDSSVRSDNPVVKGNHIDVKSETLCSSTSKMADNASHLHVFNCVRDAPMIATMDMKNQLGCRELAVLNAPLRVNSKLIENFARSFKTIDNRVTNDVNLIEVPDKDDKVKASFLEVEDRAIGNWCKNYDNADCSTWGPSMLAHILATTQLLRIPEGSTRDLCKDAFLRFAGRQYRLNRCLIDEMLSIDDFNEAQSVKGVKGDPSDKIWRLKKLWCESSDLVTDKKSYLIVGAQGMFQGVLGNSSSTLAGDGMHMSKKVSERLLSSNSFKQIGHVTSDDSTRMQIFKLVETGLIGGVNLGEAKSSARSLLRDANFIHHIIVSQQGIKRNMVKSVNTPYVQELNSVYRTQDGSISPDIKSRLSYLDYSSDPSYYGSAMRSLTLSSEYLRKEGSVTGACWIGLLSSYIHVRQFRNFELLKTGVIFDVPLELGGLPSIDPILSLTVSPVCNLVSNYTGDIGVTLSLLNEKPNMDMTKEGDMKIVDGKMIMLAAVPKCSRSGTMKIGIRAPKSRRLINEFLSDLSDPMLAQLRYRGKSSEGIKTLLACRKREESFSTNLSPSQKFCLLSSAKGTGRFLTSGSICKAMKIPEKASRDDILLAALQWSDAGFNKMGSDLIITFTTQEYDEDDNTTMPAVQTSFIELEPSGFVSDDELISRPHRIYVSNMNKATVRSVIPSSHHHSPLCFSRIFMSNDDVADKILEFQGEFKPKLLGGVTNHSVLDYIMVEDMYKQKIRKMSKNRNVVHLALHEREMSWPMEMKICASNFCEGGKAVIENVRDSQSFNTDEKILEKIVDDLTNDKRMTSFEKFRCYEDAEDMNFSNCSKGPICLLASDSVDVSCVDVTSLINQLIRGRVPSMMKKAFIAFAHVHESSSSSLPVMFMKPDSIQLPTDNKRLDDGPTPIWCDSNEDVNTGRSFTEIITVDKSSGKTVYKHHLTIYRQTGKKVRTNTKKDKYHEINLSTVEAIPVFVHHESNNLWLATGEEDNPHLLFCIGSEPRLTGQTIELHYAADFPLSDRSSLGLTKRGSKFVASTVEPPKRYRPILEDDDEEFEERDLDDDDIRDAEECYFEFFQAAKESGFIFEPENRKSSDADSDSDDNDEIDMSARTETASDYRNVRPPSDSVTHLLSDRSMKHDPEPFVMKIGGVTKTIYTHKISLTLPFKVDVKDRYDEEDEAGPFTQLMNDISQVCDEADTLWLKAFLSSAVYMNKSIVDTF